MTPRDFSRLWNKLDELGKQQADMNATLAAQAVQLAEHIRRTEALESLALVQRQDLELRVSEVKKQIAPIEKHVQMLKGAAKLLAGIGAVLGAGAAAMKIFFR